MGWPVPSCTGGAWQHCYSGSSMQCSRSGLGIRLRGRLCTATSGTFISEPLYGPPGCHALPGHTFELEKDGPQPGDPLGPIVQMAKDKNILVLKWRCVHTQGLGERYGSSPVGYQCIPSHQTIFRSGRERSNRRVGQTTLSEFLLRCFGSCSKNHMFNQPPSHHGHHGMGPVMQVLQASTTSVVGLRPNPLQTVSILVSPQIRGRHFRMAI